MGYLKYRSTKSPATAQATQSPFRDLARGLGHTAEKLTYQLRPNLVVPEQLPLTANTDADVSSLFWFVDDQFIAEVDRDEPLLWTPTAGVYAILVVDDLGRSDARDYSFEIVQ